MTFFRTLFLFLLTLWAATVLAQPNNDNCSNPTVITVGQECSAADYTSIAATSEDVSVAGTPGCGIYQGGDVWFTFEVPLSGDFRVELEGNYWELYSGICGNFSQIRCDAGSHNFREPSLAGETLYLRAYRFNSANGSDFTLCIWEPEMQANDYCADAIEIPLGQECTPQNFSSQYSSAEPIDVAGDPSCGIYRGGDVWFTFTAPASGDFRIELSGNYWELYSGICGNFTQIRCDEGSHNFREPTLAGETLYLRAFNFNSKQGSPFTLCVWEPEMQANDYCADAIEIPVGQECTPQNFSSQYSSAEPIDVAGDPSCGIYRGGDVWFTFTAPASGDFRIELNGNYWELYSGICGNFIQIRCDAGSHNFREPTLAGETLYLRAFNFNSKQGSPFTLCIWEPEMQANDYCADAIEIPVGQECTPQNFSSQYSSAETIDVAGDPSCGIYRGGDVWFTFTAPASGDFRIELSGNYWELYSGSCGNFTQIICDEGALNFSNLMLGGETLYLRAFSFNSKHGSDFTLCIMETDVPENNLCANPTNIILNDSCAVQSFSSRYSTLEDASVAQNPSCGIYRGGDIWFNFTAPESGQFTLERTANSNGGTTYFSFYTGTCGDFEEFSCSGAAEINFNDPTLGGELITVRAYSFNSRQGADFDICIKNTTIAANDMCADAIPLTAGESCTFELFDSFNTTAEADVAPTPSCGIYQGGDVWFTFEVPSTGQFQVNRNNISGGTFNYALYTGTCGNFEEYDCALNSDQTLIDALELANQTVYLRVYRWNSAFGGEFELCIVSGDCSGELGGTSYIDECDNCVGGNTGLEPCVQDCNGVFGGTAYIDECETCVGGNTGEVPCAADCNGDFGGTAYLDNCEICVGGNTGVTECVEDCNGDFGGTAFLDDCETCVEGNTGLEACIADCNGDFGGTAYLDNCEICVGGDTGVEACAADCNGDFGGTAFLDDCETCVEGNTGLEACIADCNGDFGGTAYFDNCETCVGGNTGIEACAADCNGDFGGTAYFDNCETCVGGNTELDPCAVDCNGDFGGTAYLDNCEICVGGNTGIEACAADCNGDFGGTAYFDNCETCVDGNTGIEACAADCNGDFGGTAYLDECENCVGGNTELDPCAADCNGDFGGTAYLDECENCVGGNTELDPCAADCNGDFGGTAYFDNCETCVGGNTEIDPCEADCNGDFGGTAYLDNCETCVSGNTGEVPCEADCNGVFGGTAYIDECETCVGGNTELDPCAADCNGDYGGTAYLDNCETCVGGNTELDPCAADCNGDYGGTAYFDNCETCVGGNTGLEACLADCNGEFGGTAYYDNCETCVGGNTGELACEADCNGDFGGTAYYDNCETCVGGNTGLEACLADCNGDFGGTAYYDNCETCVGGNTGLEACVADCNGDFGGTAYYDNCETCVGGNTGLEACLADCNGEFGGTAYYDNCETCVGGNTGELACEADCNGDFGGTAYYDNCETCVGGNTGLEACLADCNGEFGGTAYYDNCETCVGGNTGELACEADCNGDFGGTAYYDNCETCVDGNTGLEACVADCNGDFGGAAYYDNCETCVGGNSGIEPCIADCNGDFGGTAFIDDCGECADGNTGITPCTFDCTELQANFGDACDDANPETIFDSINADCQCQGIVVYDCEDLAANIGDSCNDDDPTTTDDMINADCVCEGTPVNPSDCQQFVYYLADFSPATGTIIYEVTLNGNVAELTYLAQIQDEVHLAYNEEHNLIYAVSKLNNSYFTLNPHVESPVFTGPIHISGFYGQITGAAFSPEGALLISSQSNNKVYSINISNNTGSVYDNSAPVRGGDIAINSEGMIYLSTNSDGGALYEVHPHGVANDVYIRSIPANNTGLAMTESGDLLLSVKNYSTLNTYTVEGDLSINYDLMLNGEPFTLNYGDMTSGCNSYEDPNPGDCANFNTFFAQYNASANSTTIYSVQFSGSDANLTELLTVADEFHIGFEAESNSLYLVSKTGSYLREYYLDTDDLSPVLHLDVSLNAITGVAFNENDGLLYISDAQTNRIYSVNPDLGTVTLFTSANVTGGDIAILEDGTMYLATQSGNALYDLNSSASPTFIGGIPAKVTGIASTNSATGLVISNYNSAVFVELNSTDASTVTAYTSKLNGEPFLLKYGDMASGCVDIQAMKNEAKSNENAHVNHAKKTILSSQPNPTSGASEVVFVTANTGRTLVEVFDMSGRNVATIFNENAQEGKEYRLDFNGHSLPNGVYIYKLTNDQESIIEKFLITK